MSRARPVVALLRAINLGSRNRVAMARLREILGEAGFEDVRTYVNSGNVVLGTTKPPLATRRAIEKAIAAEFGFAVDVVIRTKAELTDIVEHAPLADRATDGSKHFVVFCSEDPDPAAMAKLAGEDWGMDELARRGRELYVWCPEGMRDSNLMKRLSAAKLAPVVTVRNWNTVIRVVEMVRG